MMAARSICISLPLLPKNGNISPHSALSICE
jgi:hypothetical protein